VTSRKIVAFIFYDEDLLTTLALIDGIRWLFAWDDIGRFLETRDHTYS